MEEGKISKFFHNLLIYGGITLEDGIIYVWNDPNIFFPLEAFADYFYLLKQKWGKEINKILLLKVE